MVEFKFRAWHKVHKVVIPWELLQATMAGKDVWLPKDKLEISKWGDKPPMDAVHHVMKPGNFFADPNLMIMQFSGYKDAIGRDIYQGDIIKISHYNPEDYAIDILQGGFCATHPNLDGYPIDLNHFNEYEDGRLQVRVIGTAMTTFPFTKTWHDRI